MPNFIKYSDCQVGNPKNVVGRSIAFSELNFHQQNGFMLGNSSHALG